MHHGAPGGNTTASGSIAADMLTSQKLLHVNMQIDRRLHEDVHTIIHSHVYAGICPYLSPKQRVY
jgi:hypothetical protein